MDDKTPKVKYPPPFSMRFTDDERKSLEAAAAGRPLAAYIRWLIFKEDMPQIPKKRTRGETADIDQKAIGALGQSRISANINQPAKIIVAEYASQHGQLAQQHIPSKHYHYPVRQRTQLY